MKLTATEEYGLRCLIQVARRAPLPSSTPVPIRDVAEAEGLSLDYTAKLLRMLRQGELITSSRGAAGGYRLARPAGELSLSEVMRVLDTPLYGGGSFCEGHSGQLPACVHKPSCSLRVLWRSIEAAMDQVLAQVVLADLLLEEHEVIERVAEGA